MELKNRLFTERFRPSKMDEIVLLDRVKEQLVGGLKYNILMASNPGRGKTTLAYILADKMPILYINASRESSVDIIREQIVNWCSQPSLLYDYNQIKVVIIDEIDGFSAQAFKALRGTIEQFADDARFIATCNYIEQIPDAIKSRFHEVNLEAESAAEEHELKIKYYQKTASIIKELGMKTDKEGIIKLTDNYFPDLRGVVNGIEDLYMANKMEFYATDIKKYSSNYTALFDMVLKHTDSVTLYQLVNSEYAKQLDDVLISFGNDFIEYLREQKPELITKIPDILITTATHGYQSKFTIDKLVNVLSLLYTIQKIIK